MIEAMTGLPPSVLGFEVNGALHADDYRDMLLPAVEAAIQTRREGPHRACLQAL
jgi:hypothetical protein